MTLRAATAARVCASVITAVALSTIVSACAKRPPSYDQRSPEGAVTSFFNALNKGQIPAQLDQLVHDDHELATWRARCKFRGCNRATFEIGEISMITEARATVHVTYRVYGKNDGHVARGTDSPFTLIREGDHWYIIQIGNRTVIHSRDPDAEPSAPSAGEANAATAGDAATPTAAPGSALGSDGAAAAQP